jgi:hypothetical protein
VYNAENEQRLCFCHGGVVAAAAAKWHCGERVWTAQLLQVQVSAKASTAAAAAANATAAAAAANACADAYTNSCADACANAYTNTRVNAVTDACINAVTDACANAFANAFADAFADALANAFADAFANALANAFADALADTFADALADTFADTFADAFTNAFADTLAHALAAAARVRTVQLLVEPKREYAVAVVHRRLAVRGHERMPSAGLVPVRPDHRRHRLRIRAMAVRGPLSGHFIFQPDRRLLLLQWREFDGAVRADLHAAARRVRSEHRRLLVSAAADAPDAVADAVATADTFAGADAVADAVFYAVPDANVHVAGANATADDVDAVRVCSVDVSAAHESAAIAHMPQR